LKPVFLASLKAPKALVKNPGRRFPGPKTLKRLAKGVTSVNHALRVKEETKMFPKGGNTGNPNWGENRKPGHR